ncbi:hypothetical protein GGI25_001866 [Coemansia spiralis]|uniref:Glutathione S-transferase n=2 Tax=Coemansia TaxID=4863 RepID=A0A9W8G9Y3_9FUNG|nr:glutathione S-transferase [Coemansia spiralis]KAJ1993928.1 hypothetical protein EDC05_001839 [Coemansia umbellata]KAJ2622693.1 hypothetical protein GGI26_002962 [Coemansia sp. RSA 1358]KAJ2679094.1 hypothetical protein GGI25_001866 [Coemansia spiralis]
MKATDSLKLTLFSTKPVAISSNNKLAINTIGQTDHHPVVKRIYHDHSNYYWYNLVNPQLKVPALRTPEGTILIGSNVIAEYIADKYQESGLLPAAPTERAQLRLFLEIFNSRIIPKIFSMLRAATKEGQEKERELLLAGIKEASKELEKQWQRPSGKGGPFWFGDHFSLAEVNTVSFVNKLAGPAHWRGFSVPQADDYAAFNKWVKAFSTHPVYTKFSFSNKDIAKGLAKFVPEAN